MSTVLEINDLNIRYEVEGGRSVQAVDDVSLGIEQSETFGLVGESGCGKTTLAHSLLHLLDPNGSVESGEIWFDGALPRWLDGTGDIRREIIDDPEIPVRRDGMVDLTELDTQDVRDIRWREIALIPQNAMNALNPVYKVGDQIVEAILRHEPKTTKQEADERTRELLETVGIGGSRADDYAHEFSGGMKQRAVIAMALSCNPTMLIADEPTTALDVIIQDRVLEEILELQEEFDLSMLVISHDISVIAEISDHLGVMYGGKLMEVGPKPSVLDDPSNPYTLGLKNSFPRVTEDHDLISIPGSPPTVSDPADECRFIDRCPFAEAECRRAHPPTYDVAAAESGRREEAEDHVHRSACYRIHEIDQLRTEAREDETWQLTETTD
jgi:oligopeptide/dipeptide ABC transporter ATP-binding protein